MNDRERRELGPLESEHLEPALRYVTANGLFPRSIRQNGLDETNAQLAARIESGRQMSDRIASVFPEAPNQGFHYGRLSSFAHMNPAVYFQNWGGNEFILGFGAAMTALKAATKTVCEALQLPYEDQKFDFWS